MPSNIYTNQNQLLWFIWNLTNNSKLNQPTQLTKHQRTSCKNSSTVKTFHFTIRMAILCLENSSTWCQWCFASQKPPLLVARVVVLSSKFSLFVWICLFGNGLRPFRPTASTCSWCRAELLMRANALLGLRPGPFTNARWSDSIICRDNIRYEWRVSFAFDNAQPYYAYDLA